MPIKRHHSNDGDTAEKSQKAVKKPKPSEKITEKVVSTPEVEEKIPLTPTLPVLKFNEVQLYTESSESFNSQSWLKSWESTIKNIRSKKNFLAENNLTQPEVDKVQRDILLMVCGLKKLNREVQYKLRERRDEVKRTSIACDQEDVQLQNVIYSAFK